MMPDNSPLKMLVCYYDSLGIPYTEDGIMFPIQAGKAVSDTDLHIQGDNELDGHPCDNISGKNPSYSELTALYWTWKNLKKLYPDVKYVGWTHYRRFFAFDERRILRDIISKPASAIKDYRVNAAKVTRILEGGKIILAKKVCLGLPIDLHYWRCHHGKDYRTLKRIIKEKFPDYYDSFIRIMELNNKISLYCMFVMKYEDFENYCGWLFSVLSEAEKEVPYQNYSPYQKRVFAFMAERLLNVYVAKNNLKPEYFNVYLYDNSKEDRKITERLEEFPIRLLSCCFWRLVGVSILCFRSLRGMFKKGQGTKKFPLKPQEEQS